jgi:hypothetical protein
MTEGAYPMRSFLQKRLSLAHSLTENPDASYGDIVLILTAVISACAAYRWPGKGIDRQRFVELVALLTPSGFHAGWVSVPALIANQHLLEADTPLGLPSNAGRIFCDDDVDMPLSEAKKQYPHIPQQILRGHSYAALIYEWLRCGYAHEYCPHENITTVPPSRRKARASYIRRGDSLVVSFHLNYLVELAQQHVSALPDAALPRPAHWWCDTA